MIKYNFIIHPRNKTLLSLNSTEGIALLKKYAHAYLYLHNQQDGGFRVDAVVEKIYTDVDVEYELSTVWINNDPKHERRFQKRAYMNRNKAGFIETPNYFYVKFVRNNNAKHTYSEATLEANERHIDKSGKSYKINETIKRAIVDRVDDNEDDLLDQVCSTPRFISGTPEWYDKEKMNLYPNFTFVRFKKAKKHVHFPDAESRFTDYLHEKKFYHEYVFGGAVERIREFFKDENMKDFNHIVLTSGDSDQVDYALGMTGLSNCFKDFLDKSLYPNGHTKTSKIFALQKYLEKESYENIVIIDDRLESYNMYYPDPTTKDGYESNIKKYLEFNSGKKYPVSCIALPKDCTGFINHDDKREEILACAKEHKDQKTLFVWGFNCTLATTHMHKSLHPHKYDPKWMQQLDAWIEENPRPF